jgi:hypothetical protein
VAGGLKMRVFHQKDLDMTSELELSALLPLLQDGERGERLKTELITIGQCDIINHACAMILHKNPSLMEFREKGILLTRNRLILEGF